MAGHRALDFKSGCLKVGYSADLLIWDINRINAIPLYNPLAAIIYSSYPDNIIHTLVDGRFLKRDGKVLGKDGIEGMINQRARDIQLRGKGKTDIRF
jgi:5-methylthioadenosine/S-adenosylhomocysteine deaminase